MKNKLKAFTQLGFHLRSEENETQYEGGCPFCNKNHFFINKKNSKWDCKSCGKSGGYSKFLKEIIAYSKENFKGIPAKKLADERSLSLTYLRKFDVGYLPFKKIYIIAYKDMIQIYNFKNFIMLSGSKIDLFNFDELTEKKGTVWITEGFWDLVAMYELLGKNIGNDVCISVVGAGNFKAEWSLLLRDRKVNVVFDNDNAGFQGGLKIYNSCRQSARELKFIHWKKELKQGYDIRDFKKYGHDLRLLKSYLEHTPQGVEEVETEVKSNLNGAGLHYKKVYEGYRKWLHLPDTNIIDIVYGTMIANRLDGDPIWLFLVGVPGCTKTEMLMSLGDAPKTFSISALQPHMLVSGYRAGGSDPSLILKLDQKVLLIKDFTTTLSMNQNVQEETFGVLRDIYDGEHVRFFGNNAGGIYKSKFGLIAAVTPAIEQNTETHAALGERFLRYRIKVTEDTNTYLKKAIRNVGGEKKMRNSLRDLGAQVLNHNFTKYPEVADFTVEKILKMAQYVAIMRGTVVRDRYSKEVLFQPFVELGTRLSKQFYKLLLGIGMFKHETKISKRSFNCIKEIAQSSIPMSMNIIVKKVYNNDYLKEYTGSELMKIINLPRGTCMRYIENLTLLNVLKKESINSSSGLTGNYKWRLTEKVLNLLKGSKIYD